MAAPILFDRKLLTARRARAARAEGLPDFLLRRAAGDIGERLAAVSREFERVLCLGAYHGVIADALPPAIPASGVTFMETSPALLARCPGMRVCADEEALPFRDGAFDLVVSALSLHLVNDLPGALVQIRRALKPDGLFLAAVLGGGTLGELREAFMAAEIEVEGGASPRVAPMAEIRDYGALLQRAGFAMPVADTDVVEVTYPSPLALMRDVRDMGAANALAARRRQFLRRETLARVAEIYCMHYPAPGGRVKATFEIVHLSGWAPHDNQQKPLAPGSAQVALADALRAAADKPPRPQ